MRGCADVCLPARTNQRSAGFIRACHGRHQMDYPWARICQLQLRLRLSLPVQRLADAGLLHGCFRHPDRQGASSRYDARRPSDRRRVCLAGADPSRQWRDVPDRRQARGRGPAQRHLRIMRGQDTTPGATMFNIFASMLSKSHDPVFADIDFEVDLKKRRATLKVDGYIDQRGEPIVNPVTGAEYQRRHRARRRLRIYARRNGARLVEDRRPDQARPC